MAVPPAEPRSRPAAQDVPPGDTETAALPHVDLSNLEVDVNLVFARLQSQVATLSLDLAVAHATTETLRQQIARLQQEAES